MGTGKKKIEIKKITKESSRMVTFSKRRKGLFKKAVELESKTSGVQVAVLVFSPTGKPYTCGGNDVLTTFQNHCDSSHSSESATNVSRKNMPSTWMLLIDALQIKYMKSSTTSIANTLDPFSGDKDIWGFLFFLQSCINEGVNGRDPLNRQFPNSEMAKQVTAFLCSFTSRTSVAACPLMSHAYDMLPIYSFSSNHKFLQFRNYPIHAVAARQSREVLLELLLSPFSKAWKRGLPNFKKRFATLLHHVSMPTSCKFMESLEQIWRIFISLRGIPWAMPGRSLIF